MWPEAYIVAEFNSRAIRTADARARAWPNHAALVEAFEVCNAFLGILNRGGRFCIPWKWLAVERGVLLDLVNERSEEADRS